MHPAPGSAAVGGQHCPADVNFWRERGVRGAAKLHGLFRRSPGDADYKKIFRAPAMPGRRAQPFAAPIVNLILTHSDFPRGKNL